MPPKITVTRLALTMLAIGAAAASPLAMADQRQVPFKASVVTQEVLNPLAPDFTRCPLSGLVGTTTGQGTASHMGAVTLMATDCPLTNDYVNFFFSDGRLTLTAANGDKLTATYSGSLLPVPGANPPVHAINGSFAVTGGTGRFAGARGGGSLQGSEDLATLKGRYEVIGMLSLAHDKPSDKD